MMPIKNLFLTVGLLLALQSSPSAQAASPPNLQNLNLPQLDSVFKVFGADMIFRPLEPASSHVDVFGVSFGAVAGLTSTKKVKSEISGVDINYIPAGDIYVGLHGPFGLALELGFIPALTLKDIKLEQYGGDLKWTINKVFFGEWLPVDVALRAMYSSANILYKQTINGVADVIDYSTKLYGFNLSASKQLLFIEPYAGIGWIKQEANLSNTGTIRLFETSITASNSIDKNIGTAWLFAGVQFHIFMANLTAEYSNIFGVHTYATKLGFKF